MSLQKTPISILQELMVQKGLPVPVYDIETTSDMPSPNRFVCTVACAGIRAVGKGSTKKDAKHDSAKNALSAIGYKTEAQIRLGDYINGKFFSQKEKDCHEITNKHIFSPQKTFVNYVGKLNEIIVSKRFFTQPTYEFDVDLSSGGFVATCKIGNISIIGLGLNKKDAKQNAAQLMLEELSKNDSYASELAFKDYTQSADFEDNTKRVIEKFKELSILNNNFVPKKECKELHPIIPFKDIVVKEEPEEEQTLAELKEYLDEHEFHYTWHVLQKNPLIVMVTSKDSIITLLGAGRTKELALCDALKQAVLIVKHGCSLSFDPDC